MNDSSKPWRRRRKGAPRVGDRRCGARRLGIESMESRVLLSGNPLDLSTFGVDLAPVAYPQSAVPTTISTEVMSNSLLRDANYFQFDGLGEGGVANIVPGSGMTSGIPSEAFPPLGSNGSNATNSVFEPGTVLHANGGADPSVVVKSADGDLHLSGLGTTHVLYNPVDAWRADFDSAWQPAAIAPSGTAALVRHPVSTRVESEGGSIPVAGLVAAFSKQSNSLEFESAAKTEGGVVDLEPPASRVAVNSPSFASAQVEGEWARAIAMESVGADGSVGSADRHESRGASAQTGDAGPLSSDAAHSRAVDERTENVTATEPIDASVDRLNSLLLSAEQTVDLPRVMPVAINLTGSDFNRGPLATPAHRLEASGHVAGNSMAADLSAANAVRDEVFSRWRPGLPADTNLMTGQASEHTRWVNPAPFLAVLALERFVALEPRDERRHAGGPTR